MVSARLVVRVSLPMLLLAGLIGCASQNNPLHTAAILGGPDELNAAMKQPGASMTGWNRHHNAPLHEAVLHDNEPAVRWFIAHQANLNIRDNNGDTPLHFAATKGFTDVMEDLLKAGADVNTRNLDRKTPLHVAAANAATDVCKVLLAHGADINAKDADGNTPLHLAASGGSGDDDDEDRDSGMSEAGFMEMSAETVEFLLSKGANPNLRNLDGQTPRMRAIDKGNHLAAQAFSHHAAK